MAYKEARRVGRGNPVVKIACPMCGWYRQLEGYGISQKTGLPREVRFDKVDVETAPILRVTVMSGAGYRSRNASIETVETMTLVEIPEELKAQIKSQCNRILAVLG